jgi:crotonobetaine/carnitine-CoA ligase
MWSERVAASGNHPFLTFKDAAGTVSEWTYGQFDLWVRDARTVLMVNGVTPGDAVHVALRNCPAFVALWLACATLGALFVPVDPASTEREIYNQLVQIRPRVGFCGSERETNYRGAASAAQVKYLLLGESSNDHVQLRNFGPEQTHERPSPSDRLAVMFTSGTTARPKGVVLTQANYWHVGTEMAKASGLTPSHRWYVTLPLFHANAQFYCFAPAIAVGASVALTHRFSASSWVRDAFELHVTHASLFAAPIRMILARTPKDSPKLALEHVWFAQSVGALHYEVFSELVGIRPRQLYGMTETIAIVSADGKEAPRHDIIGRPAAGRLVQLIDESTGKLAEPGNPGMIHVAGVPGTSLFLEYLDDPRTTAQSLSADDAGITWLRTGDLAVDVGGGVFQFVGRSDDVIKVAGENVSLTEIEAALAQAPGVLEVAVLGKPDPVRDVVPVAYVVARNPANPPSPEGLDAWARDNLVPPARPREWHLISELPRTSVGKLKRFVIGSDEA